jgi:signal transduction histidine kinase
MTRFSRKVQVAIASALAIVGLGFLLQGVSAATRADAALLRASSATVSRIREIDRIAIAAQLRDAQATADIEEALRQATDPAEADVLERARKCIVPGGGCSESPIAALDPVREYYGKRLDLGWSTIGHRRRVAWWMIAIGISQCAGGFLLVAAVAVRRVPPREQAPGSTPGRAAVEATLRSRLEELYAARLQAWQTDRFAAAGEIAAGLSHGLKTPLASIRAAAQLAQVKLGDGHAAAPQLNDIIEETDSLVAQVRRFLQATSAAVPLLSRLSPRQLIESLEREYAPIASERGIAWRAGVEPGVEDVNADPGLLEMACRNLVENALSAAPRGSELTVRVRRTDAPARAGLDETPPPPGRWIEIVIRDEGPGIPALVASGAQVRSDKPGGSGLGVAIARRIVARHGGALVFESGSGTTARMLLPASEPASGSEAA